jgi:GT2 family glycosyltransferase
MHKKSKIKFYSIKNKIDWLLGQNLKKNLAFTIFRKSTKDMVIHLKEKNQLKRLEHNSPHWESQGTDPYFFPTFDKSASLSAGWYIFEISMDISNISYDTAKLYFDTGSGFNEKETLTLLVKPNEITRKIFFLNKQVRKVRFDPLECAGQFKITSINLTRVRKSFAIQFMLNELEKKNQTSSEYTLPSSIMELFSHYNRLFDNKPDTIIYQDWINKFEVLNQPTPNIVQVTLKNFSQHPLVSIILPTYNTPEVFLRACIDSVINQSYPNWELCIADDASSSAHIRPVLQEYVEKDHRIQVIYRKENGHISNASNSALSIARGEYVALMDHDDLLAEHALLHIVEALQTEPRPLFLYSDEDKVDGLGRRIHPHFKSKWNYDLLLSQNYITHLMVVERKLLQEAGGFRVGLEGSQDHDLAIRLAEYLPDNLIRHIPRVLYHWRITEGSTALHADAKSYTEDASIKALQDHFTRTSQQNVQVIRGILPNTYRPTYPLPTPKPLVSLLIPTRDKLELLQPCIRSILNKTDYPDYEIVILDNGSVEPETRIFFEEVWQESSNIRILPFPFPFNYSAINNFGVKHANGSVIGLINNDVEVISSDWLTEMVSHACRPGIGCVGAKLYFSDGSLQHAGVMLGIGGVAGHSHKYFPGDAHGYFSRLKVVQNLSAVTGACLVVRKEIYEEVGGLDEENLKVAFNDVDFCLKVREAGYRNLWTPFAELYHHESKSRGHEDTSEKQARFEKEVLWMKKKWGDTLMNDPYYNPNLTLEHEDFSLKLTLDCHA